MARRSDVALWIETECELLSESLDFRCAACSRDLALSEDPQTQPALRRVCLLKVESRQCYIKRGIPRVSSSNFAPDVIHDKRN